MSNEMKYAPTSAEWERAGVDGARISAARHAAGLSQNELAHRVGASSAVTVSTWETDRNVPSPIFKKRLVEVLGAEALGLDLDDEGTVR